MVHLTVGIGKFFGHLLGAVFEAAFVAISLGAVAFVGAAALALGLRRLRERRRP